MFQFAGAQLPTGQIVGSLFASMFQSLGYSVFSMVYENDGKIKYILVKAPNAVSPSILRTLSLSVNGEVYSVEYFDRAYMLTEDDVKNATKTLSLNEESAKELVAEILMKARMNTSTVYYAVVSRSTPKQEGNKAIEIIRKDDSIELRIPGSSIITTSYEIEMNRTVTKVTINQGAEHVSIVLDGSYALRSILGDGSETVAVLERT